MSLPVVLLHGFMQDSRTWNSVLERMRPEGVYALDYVRDASGYSLPELAQSVHQSVERILDETGALGVLLVGYSMGGRVALEYARLYPESLAGLVLESAGLGCVSEDVRERYAARNLEWARQMEASESIEEIVEWWERLPLFSSQLNQPEEVQRTQRAMRLAQDPHSLAAQLRDGGVQNMPLQERTLDMMVSLPMPVLYVAGSKDEKYSRKARAAEAAGVAVDFFDCGHNVHMEQPGEFAQLLNRVRGVE